MKFTPRTIPCRYIVVTLPDDTPGIPALNVVAQALRDNPVFDTDSEDYTIYGYYDGDIEFKGGPGL